jgi:serine/threonine protein kinase
MSGIGDPTKPEIPFEPPPAPDDAAPPEQSKHSTTPPTIVQVDRPGQLRGPGTPEIPGYEVIEEIARGGMGVVYAARDLTLGREVAIKTLLPELAGNWQHAAQFDREARITARLPHPCIPTVYALGLLADGRPFLVMKFIRGKTLSSLLKTTILPAAPSDPHDLLQVFEQVCQAIGFAHSQRIIHRDLKPANVMVGGFGIVQVMDWGLARTLDSNVPDVPARGEFVGKVTQSGEPKGTPGYMPPEQARGDWAHVDTRADVFALGAILTAILTGSPPYHGARPMDLLRRAASADLADAFRRLDACAADAELITLAKACLSPDPANRPADAAVVAGLVASYRSGREERLRRAEARRAAVAAESGVRTAPPDLSSSGRREVVAEILRAGARTRRRVITAVAAAAGLVAGSLGAGVWYEYGPGSRPPAQTTQPCQSCPCASSPGAG